MDRPNFKNCLFCCAGVRIDNPREDSNEDEFRRKLEIFAYHCSIDPKLIPVNCDPIIFPLCLRCQERVDAISESHDAIQAANGIISFQIGNIQDKLMRLDWLKKGGDDVFKPARDKIVENSKRKLNEETEKWMRSCWVRKVVNGKVTLQLEPLPSQPDFEGRTNPEASGGVNLQVENDTETGLDGQDNGEGAANLTSGDGNNETSGSQAGGDGGDVENQDVFLNSDDETDNQLPTSPRPSPSSSGVALSTEKRSLRRRRASTNSKASSRSDDDEADDFDNSPEVTGNKKRKLTGNNNGFSGRLPEDVEEPAVNLLGRWGGSSSLPVNTTSLLASPVGSQKLSASSNC